MRFFATQFSTILPGLLILSTPFRGDCMNLLKTNNIKDEEKMPITRDEVPVKDRWNVEALYLDPESWKEDLKMKKSFRS